MTSAAASFRSAAPKKCAAQPSESCRPHSKRQPKYHVILWDDDDHTYRYVITMMRELFGHTVERGFQIANSVDNSGRAVCLTTTLEHAELKRDQIHAYGRDKEITACVGSMWSTVEPAV